MSEKLKRPPLETRQIGNMRFTLDPTMPRGHVVLIDKDLRAALQDRIKAVIRIPDAQDNEEEARKFQGETP